MKITFVAILMALSSLTSCERGPDFHFHTSRTVPPNAEVFWTGISPDPVGRVTAVESDDGRLRVSVELAKRYRGTVHKGVTARQTTSLRTGAQIVKLDGGRDASAPIIRRGAEIPEFRRIIDGDWLKPWLPLIAPRVERHFTWLLDEVNSPAGERLLQPVLQDLKRFEGQDLTIFTASLKEVSVQVAEALQALIREAQREDSERQNPGPK
jgi:hypothetical protein